LLEQKSPPLQRIDQSKSLKGTEDGGGERVKEEKGLIKSEIGESNL